MHEFAAVEQLLRLVAESARENDIKRVEKVKLVVGLGSTFVPSVIEFLFESMATEPPFSKQTELELVTEPLRVKCSSCDREYEHEGWRWKCPHCGGTDLEQLAGNTIYVESYEGA